jgi:hypothetical protein
MGWSKAVSVVTMLGIIIALLAHIVLHRKSETTDTRSLLY